MEIKINETHLIVLKKDSSNDVKIDYVEIVNPLRKELDNLYKLSEDEQYSLENLKTVIYKNEEFKKILERRNFCKHLDFPFQGINTSSIDYDSFFDIEDKKDKELKKEEKRKLSQEKKEKLISEYKYRDLPYAIEITYEKCENNPNILAYSHRKVGWAMPKYNLVNHFSIQFKTNFGYGGVSYFFTKMKYKEIDIIPFSDWIIYQKAQLYEIIRYSVRHKVNNESWFDAMNYAKEAIDIFNNNEKNFITKYILNECKDMVEGLERILSNHIFPFKQYNGEYENYEYKDKRLLIEFRGEKISGALKFITNIIEYKNIIEVKTFIDTIINLNKTICPILKEELDAIRIELKNVKYDFDIVKGKYEPVKEEYNFHIQLKNKFRKVINKKEKDLKKEGGINIDKCFLERYPKFKELEDNYKTLKEEYYKLDLLIDQLIRFERNFNKYTSEIDSFINKNNT